MPLIIAFVLGNIHVLVAVYHLTLLLLLSTHVRCTVHSRLGPRCHGYPELSFGLIHSACSVSQEYRSAPRNADSFESRRRDSALPVFDGPSLNLLHTIIRSEFHVFNYCCALKV